MKESPNCVQAERIDNSQISPELNSIPKWASHAEVIMQKDLLPELPPSGGFENTIIRIDVISRYAFACQVCSPTADKTAKVIIDILTRHASIPTLMITDTSLLIFSNVIHETTEVLDITLHHATTKHAEFIGVLEKTRATKKTWVKMSTGEFCKEWKTGLVFTASHFNLKNNVTHINRM